MGLPVGLLEGAVRAENLPTDFLTGDFTNTEGKGDGKNYSMINGELTH